MVLNLIFGGSIGYSSGSTTQVKHHLQKESCLDPHLYSQISQIVVIWYVVFIPGTGSLLDSLFLLLFFLELLILDKFLITDKFSFTHSF